jgi:hypothetical protein
MAWKVKGRSFEMCSCNMLCPCWLGPEGQPDKGWCSGAFGFDIEDGQSDGVQLGGSKVVAAFEWPGNFFAGNGTAKLYIDEGASAEQRRELEGIFTGKKGGHLEGLFGAVVAKWLQPQVVRIDLTWGDRPSLKVGDVVECILDPVKDPAGRRTSVSGAAALAAFQIDSMDLASSRGSTWRDPDLRTWSGDSGTLHMFDWQA